MMFESEESRTSEVSSSASRFCKRHGFKFLLILLLFAIAGRRLHLVPNFFPMPAPLSAPAPLPFQPVMTFEFSEPSVLEEWEEHLFHDKSKYEVAGGAGSEPFLKASSVGTSSALYREANVPSEYRPVLSWQWRAVRFPAGKKNKTFAAKSDNDYAARVYVIFGKNNPLMSDVIQYVWDDHFPEGTRGRSPFSSRVRALVVQQGPPSSPSEWVSETRDLVGDYQMLFGKPPRNPIRAVALMSDSDNTHTASEAHFKRLELGKPAAR